MPMSISASTSSPSFSLISLILVAFLAIFACSQPAAWPATSYSPYFQSMFAQASAPVAALPSGAGAQAPAIPVGGGGGPGGPGPVGMAAPGVGRK